MEKLKINDKVILLKNMPFDLCRGDICIITNISASDSPYKLFYHIKKDKDSRYEFRVERNDIKKSND